MTFVGVADGWASGWSSKVESEGRKGVVFQTIDGGAHWKPIGNIPNESVYMIVRFSDKEHGWLAGRDSLYRTDDGGNSWRVVLKLSPIGDL